MTDQHTPTQFIIITGLSGSGKSGTIKCFEDLGFFCVDNLPAKLIPTFVQLCTKKGEEISRVALIVDIRERDFLQEFPGIYQELKEQGYSFQILFLEASDDVLVRRFSETRRPHPLAFDRPVTQGIAEERNRLMPIRELSDIIIDTSTINIHELREHINKLFSPASTTTKPLVLSIISFGYKHGIPFNSDIILDVRFLPNPFFREDLKNYTGLDPRVKEYVFSTEDSRVFMNKLQDMVIFLLPRYLREGKTYLTISIGCTGGKHRSVAIADFLESFLREQGYQVRCKHRDIQKE
ncbi:MAG: RNase adapter RapZ [Acidobacteria bacterium]|nr:MAG: RNase adapter RapZ [Acidobacteriota bacterium]